MTTTVSISKRAKAAGMAMATAERRSLSGQIEFLILEEAIRRGLLNEMPVKVLRVKGGRAAWASYGKILW
ncbi:MAG: hypothetical protein JWM59_1292 [Verrucomicrobiales bacterium]|nr:hypothetical protein [Verrucomicrobiales bacterium]